MQCIFIIGAARSGTTLLYEALCRHPDVAYITDQLDYEYWTKLNSPYSWRPIIDRPDRPNEGNSFWLRYLPYWKYMTDKDVSSEMRDYFVSEVGNILGAQQKFLNKNPHHSYRVKLLDAIFPNSKFIHIIRDGRAVAYSEYVRRPKDWDNEPVRELVGYDSDRSDLYNIGLEWSSMVRIARIGGQDLGAERYIEIKYEDLVSSASSLVNSLAKVFRFCGIEIVVSGVHIRGRENEKWKHDLDANQIVDLVESTYELRAELGYM